MREEGLGQEQEEGQEQGGLARQGRKEEREAAKAGEGGRTPTVYEEGGKRAEGGLTSPPSLGIGLGATSPWAGAGEGSQRRQEKEGKEVRGSKIGQLDGNVTTTDSDEESETEDYSSGSNLRMRDHMAGPHGSSTEAATISVQIGLRPALRPAREYRQAVLRKVASNDRVAKSSELPTLAATNMRSLPPKIRNFTEDILQRQVSVCFVSETWEQNGGSKKFQKEIERMFELFGLKFVSCSRPSNKRGGGAAIVVDTARFSCEKLNVLVPGRLECVWAIIRPKNVTKNTQFKEIVLCAFYSPPRSRKNSKLLDHIISTLHLLLTKYPNCGWAVGGDKNQCPVGPLLGALPRSRQIVTRNTYKRSKIYDIILTNMGQYYSVPYVSPAVQPDDCTSGAVPSDHDMAVAEPLAGAGLTSTREYRLKTSQPFPQSGINEFGAWLSSVPWEHELSVDLSPTDMARKMEKMCNVKVKAIFPIKHVRICNDDKPFITAQIKKLDRYVKKEYKLKGKSEKYLKLKSVYDLQYKKASTDFLRGCVTDMMCEAPGKAYRAMKKLGARPGDCDLEAGFLLSSHIEQNLTPTESVERLADYFSSISQEYSPLHIDSLPKSVRDKIQSPVNCQDIPKIESFQVWELMKQGRKTKSSVPNELPAKLRHEFGPELAEPASIIFNQIATSGLWPDHWKEGSAVPLKKVPDPKDESETRLIEITYYLSLQMEKIVLQWLLSFISEKLDRDQFGGAKGHSVAHYLIEIMNFVLYNQDLSEPASTILAAVDVHKGFNKVSHQKTITILATEMQVPGWLLRIVASYLSGRSLKIRYLNKTSTCRQMPGGTAAGTILGLNLFLILFNGAGPEPNPRGIGQYITQTRRQPIQKMKVKWIDDSTLCTAIDLKASLVPEDRPVPRPLQYHARTEHRLPRHLNPMQDELDELAKYVDNHLMAVNRKKTQAMLCNTRQKWDMIPELYFKGEQIQIVEEIKVVGFVLRNDMKTWSNTAYITGKAYKRMWLIRRLKALGASTAQLTDTLEKQVLSVLWLGAPAWYCLLTQAEKTHIDRVAKVGLKIIFGEEYCGFENSVQVSGISKPTERLEKMTKRFAVKSAKHPKFSKWFEPLQATNINTRSKKKKYIQIHTRTERYARSPIPHLTNLLNAL